MDGIEITLLGKKFLNKKREQEQKFTLKGKP